MGPSVGDATKSSLPCLASLVNPRHVKNVPGRKSDVMDCQWLQYLHSVGLLRAAFRPAAEVRGVRALWRQRDALVRHSR